MINLWNAGHRPGSNVSGSTGREGARHHVPAANLPLAGSYGRALFLIRVPSHKAGKGKRFYANFTNEREFGNGIEAGFKLVKISAIRVKPFFAFPTRQIKALPKLSPA